MKLDNLVAERNRKAIYHDGDKVIKLFDEDYSHSDILNEALNQTRVEEAGLPVPKVLEVTSIDGKWAIVSEYIEGTPLNVMMEQNPEKVDEYMTKLVELQMLVNSKKSPLLTKLREKMNRNIGLSNIDATTRYDIRMRLESMPRHDKICHGDFNPSNIIVTPEGEYYIIDWSHATQGNASADAARTYLLFSFFTDNTLAENYLNTFCKMTDTAKQYVQRWLPIVAAAQLSKGVEEEKALLESWIDVVEYE